MRVLVIEDEADLARAIARSLREARFAVDVSLDGEDGLFHAIEIDYDAIVLDLMLPRVSGFDVLDALRRAQKTTPLLILTARDGLEDRLRGLNGGADDYLTKPFMLEELVARLHALIRRAARDPAPRLTLGEVSVDLVAHRVYRGGQEVDLTAREFDILRLLAERRGIVVPRRAIAEHLYADSEELLSNAIDVHVAALRRKLGPDVIRTRRGRGYLIDV